MNATARVLVVSPSGVAEPGGIGGEYEVVEADGAVDALTRLAGSPAPDCVVTPASLPDLDLAGFLDRARRAAPAAAVVVTGDLPPGSDAGAALADADAYVPPAAAGTLAGRIAEALVDRRIDRAVERDAALARAVAAVGVAGARATDRTDVESAVYDRLVEGDWYRHVWVVRRDGEGEYGAARPAVGRLDGEDLAAIVGGDGTAFLARAVEAEGVVTTANAGADHRAGGSAAPEGRRGGRTTRELATAAVPFVDGGRVHGVVLLSTDRPDAFEASERALLTDLGAVVGNALSALDSPGPEPSGAVRGMENLVHDLRNPLGIARSHAAIAREDDDMESLERVESALSRMVDTVDRVAAGLGEDDEVDAAPADLAAAAEAAWSSFESEAASLRIDDAVPIRADEELLGRLLSNLFRNAVDHAGEGVTVRVGTMTDGFYVEDDGPGIPSGERAAVVERGYSTSSDGLGIGLSIVQDVADAHGWSLAVTEADDGGARFELTGVEQVGENEVA